MLIRVPHPYTTDVTPRVSIVGHRIQYYWEGLYENFLTV